MKILNYLKLHIWLPISGCLGFVVIVVVLFVVLKLQFTSVFPFIGTSGGIFPGGSGPGVGSAQSQPEISDMILKIWNNDAGLDTIVSRTDVADWGLYASEFTFKVTNSAAVSRVKVSLVNSQGEVVTLKSGSPAVRIPDDDGLPGFAKTDPSSVNTFGHDKVAGDGIFTVGVTGEIVDYFGWCSFPEGQYQLKVDISVTNTSNLKDVTASYPIYIAKNCE
jgi:hypothetical protein